MALPLIAASLAAPIIGGIVGNALGAKDRGAASAASDQAVANINNVSTQYIIKFSSRLSIQPPLFCHTCHFLQIRHLDARYLRIVLDIFKLCLTQVNGLFHFWSHYPSNLIFLKSDFHVFNRRRASETQQMSNQKAILENRAARGMAGSGDELAAQLQASQSGANRASQESRAVAALALQNQMNALQGSSSLASNLDAQQYAKAKAAAEAGDSISRFNVQNQQNVANTNVQNRNTAQQQNLSNQQNVANSNVDVANRQETANKGLYQQDFNNRMTKAQASANALTGQASNLQAAANATGSMWGDIGAGVGKAGMAYGMNTTDPTKVKKG